MGCYPLFACRDWSRLQEDLEALPGELVSVAMVTDPFGDYDEDLLCCCFPDVMKPFKAHFVAELTKPIDSIASKHHRYYARKALHDVTIEVHKNPVAFVDEWTDLYSTLIERHHLKGIKAFSREAFIHQLSLPGTVLLRAIADNETIGAHIWYVQDVVAYSHLAACNERGYEKMASYALYWRALEYFSGQVRWLDIGAGAGTTVLPSGLDQFKSGWSTGTRPAYFCGRIYDQDRYAEIARARNTLNSSYFPAYRQGELSS